MCETCYHYKGGGFDQVNAFQFALRHLSSMCVHYIQVSGQGRGWGGGRGEGVMWLSLWVG